ncbi:unnamed protein product [Bemisia tabaci]|uniref:Uncharacterized protein n=1 Tax=Bemisia tabaci TaxID=7038 RepID=A0A9P0A9G1_BEMTA|nr:PREDICTED: rap1 GTPase-GDP dissociation stimulator 1-B isoform X1 [Bemisia tabaci]CAH0387037.1 unnamed protein product [Bemisia tabaci]
MEGGSDNLSELFTELSLAVDQKSDKVSVILDNLCSKVDKSQIPDEFASDCSSIFSDQLHSLLGWSSSETVTKTADVIASLAKIESTRVALTKPKIAAALLEVLKQNAGLSSDQNYLAMKHASRALGNLCYENNEGRKCVMEHDGLKIILHAIESTINLPDKELCYSLRACVVGLLLNLIMGQTDLYPELIKLGTVELLTKILEAGAEQDETAAIHVLMILSLLAESVNGEPLLTNRLCSVLVKTLGKSTSGELSELCVELIHGQAENNEIRLQLAKCGLCELLIQLMEEHRALVNDDETRNLLKMACDLIIIILNGDDCMRLLYGDGKGKVFLGLTQWLTSTDDDLQITGVLAMGNFARTDNHCAQIVAAGVGKKLISILSKNNTPSGDIRLQHALLSALRNLSIPAQNKPKLIADGIIDVVMPMLNIPTFPVVFKLLGTLRMLVDGQERVACDLGQRKDLLKKLVEWTGTEDHPGVQGEACRLLAWLIKNSRDREVMGRMVAAGAVPCLVGMITAEHTVMQNEALLALCLLSAMRLADAEKSFIQARVGEKINTLVNEMNPPREVFMIVVAMLCQLVNSSELILHLRETGVSKTIGSYASSRENMNDTLDQVASLIALFDPML